MKTLLNQIEAYRDNSTRKFEIEHRLGQGEDGQVWQTSLGTAIKAFERLNNFEDELECYRRLLAHSVFAIDGLAVPRLMGSMRSQLIIEMTIVQVPYLLDFGKCHLDIPPAYYDDPYIIESQQAKIKQEFESNSDRVHSILRRLEEYGIYYADPHPRNICF